MNNRYSKRARINYNLQKMQQLNSPNYSKRKQVIIDMIIIHYTEVDLATTIEYFTDPKREVSSHYVITEDGEIINCVKDEEKAWHAGVSYWKGRENINEYSLGIELVNNGKEEFKKAQIDSLIKLLSSLKDKYEISPLNILGHSDVAPNRKSDPGILFPWELLAFHNIAYYPKSTAKELISGEKVDSYSKEHICNKLKKIGYKVEEEISDNDLSNLIMKMCQRFAKDLINSNWSHELDNISNQIITSENRYKNWN